MADLTVTAANVSADRIQGAQTRMMQLAAAANVGQVVYEDGSGLAGLAESDNSAVEARAIGIIVNGDDVYGGTSFAAGEWVEVCIFGPVRGFSGLNEGLKAWVGPTAGTLVDTVPSSNAYQYAVGQIQGTDTVFVNPGMPDPVSV